MKRFLLAVAAVLVMTAAAYADNAVNELRVTVTLTQDGSALFQEQWDVKAESGTELYMAREDLREMRITDLAVSDETGRQFTLLGSWDINASRKEKE